MYVEAQKVIIIFPATVFSWPSYHRSLSVISYQATMAKGKEYWRCCF